jgi:hypothetical protein
MSWATCYSGSNNIHYDFPPIMNDGRNYANWLPGGALNEKVRKEASITTNWQYRRYLSENADTIIRQNQISACGECGVTILSSEEQNRQKFVQAQTPYLYKSCLDMTKPNYGYESSDLKNMYLTELQLQSRMITPVITQEQLINQNIARSN